MKVTVVPASTKTGQAVIGHLLKSHNSDLAVVGIYRDLAKVPETFKSNPLFEARQGDVASPDTLDFAGSDVVVTMSPPLLFSPGDPIAGAKQLAENVREGVIRSGTVRRLIYISSMGAQYERGMVGEITHSKVRYYNTH